MGAAATAGNDFHAGLNLAGVLRSPVIYLVERKGTDDAPAGTVAPFGEAYGLKSFSIDGGDVLAVQAAVVTARDQLIKGGAPVLIDAELMGDPPQRYKRTLEEVGGLSASLLQEMDDSLAVEVEAARDTALASLPATTETLHQHVLSQENSKTEMNLS
jgi:TPP-dependent pyruvate/acetoin dehydrogenase alpha subunit